MQTAKLSARFGRTQIKININRNVGNSACSVISKNADTGNLKPYEDIPGPRLLPAIGPLLSFLPGGNLFGLRGIKISEQINKQYGKIARIGGFAGYKDLVWVFDTDAIQCVYRNENTLPIRITFPSLDYYRHRHNKTYDPHRLTGLMTDQGDTWWKFRSTVNQILLQPKTIQLYNKALAEVAGDMIERIKWLRNEKNVIEKKFNQEVTLWALESIGVVALGTRLNCLDRNLPENSTAMKLIENVHDFLAVVDKLDIGLSSWRYFPTPTFKKAMKVYEEQEKLTKIFINKAKENMQESKLNKNLTQDSEKSILEKLLDMDDQIAHIMASDMLLAGVDTSANTSVSTLYLIANNPEKQKKLREEVLSQQTRQPYLRACIKEAMRMMPVAYANIRLTTREYNLLGYKIPKDVNVIFPHQYLSNMEEHYPRPDEFIPERWLAEKDDPLYHGNAHPFVNNPFGFGTRSCIGRRLAELEIKTLIAEIVKNFEVGWHGPPLRIKSTSINYAMEPFNFTFKDI